MFEVAEKGISPWGGWLGRDGQVGTCASVCIWPEGKAAAGFICRGPVAS